MPGVHGSKAVFKVQDAASVLQNLSTYLTDAGLTRQIDEAETSTFGSTVKSFIAGLTEASFPLEGVWDPTVDGWLSGLTDVSVAARNWEYYPAGEPVGATKPKYSGTCVLLKYDIKTPVSDASTISAEFRATGTITRAVA